jgi:hypothetical protein
MSYFVFRLGFLPVFNDCPVADWHILAALAGDFFFLSFW